MLLAETGLIDGLEAATHWAYIRSLTANYPNVRVRGDQTLIVNGIEQRIVMAGGATSWHDLALFLIARYVGLNEAMEAAKTNLITWHDIGQQPFASLLLTKQNTDAAIAKSQEWLGSHYMRPSPVATLVKRSGLPERSFVRRFTKATGMSPLNYVHALRLEEAKQLLERGVLSIEAIANDVGYEDASFFGRLFHRKVGLTPSTISAAIWSTAQCPVTVSAQQTICLALTMASLFRAGRGTRSRQSQTTPNTSAPEPG